MEVAKLPRSRGLCSHQLHTHGVTVLPPVVRLQSHLNVVLFFISHFNRKHFVGVRFSPPQGRNNQMVVFFLFHIIFRSPLLKEKNLLKKKRIGFATQVSLLPRQKINKKRLNLIARDDLVATMSSFFLSFLAWRLGGHQVIPC